MCKLPAIISCLLQLLMLTGLRIGELVALDADDVRLTQRTGEDWTVRLRWAGALDQTQDVIVLQRNG